MKVALIDSRICEDHSIMNVLIGLNIFLLVTVSSISVLMVLSRPTILRAAKSSDGFVLMVFNINDSREFTFL